MAFLMPIPPKPPWYVMTTTARKHPSPPVLIRNAFPSLIESPTDKSTDTNNVENNNHDRPDNNNCDDDDDDDTVIHNNQYYDDDDDDTSFATNSNNEYSEYNYNDYDEDDDDDDDGEEEDDDDDSYTSSYSKEDSYHNPNLIINMHGKTVQIDVNDNVIYYADDDATTMTIQTAQKQINALLSELTTASSITAFINQAKHEYDELFSPKKNVNCTLPVIPTSPSLSLRTQMTTMMPSCTIDGIMRTRTRIPAVQSIPVQTSQHLPSIVTL